MLSRKHIAVLLSLLCLARACTPAAEPKTIGTVKLVANPSVGWTYYDTVAPPNFPSGSTWNLGSLGGGQTADPAAAEQAIQDNIEVAVFHALQDNNIIVNIKSTTNTFKTFMADTNPPLVCKAVDMIVSCTSDEGTDGAEMSGEITIELETALPEGEFEILLQGVIDDLEEHSRIEIVSSADVIFSYKP
ncbi:unnamed protein product, partial [Mesorhabditis belari]|uniref:Lipoprotein n=1 Tax=Mesorhabditis belari TaxID=2138241 RepID=A0AAF3F8M8_9BILA